MPGMKYGETGRRVSEARAILRISGPLAAAYLAEIAMGITDMVIVGRVGSVELAAVGLASSVLFEILIVTVGVVSIVAVLAAEARGAGSTEGVRHTVRQGFLVALALGIPGAVLGSQLAPVLALTLPRSVRRGDTSVWISVTVPYDIRYARVRIGSICSRSLISEMLSTRMIPLASSSPTRPCPARIVESATSHG